MRRPALLFAPLFVLACATSAGDSGSGESGESGSGESGTEVGKESSTTDTDTTETSDGGGPECGGITCASDEFCDFAQNKCEPGGREAPTCQPIPQDCEPDDPDFTVCGCDGQVYQSICEAAAAGTDVAEDLCEPPAGMFGCGWKFCTAETEVCQFEPNFEGYASFFWCDPTPPECVDDYSCACILPLYEGTAGCSLTNCSEDMGGVKIRCSEPSG
jgi:hypothetical protein